LPAATEYQVSKKLQYVVTRHSKISSKPRQPRLKARERETGKMHPIFAIAKMKRAVHLGSSQKMMTLGEKRILFPSPPRPVSLSLCENQPWSETLY